MAVSYMGKKPGKLWYFNQRCAFLLKSFKVKETKVDAAILVRDVVLAIGLMGAGIAILNTPYIMTLLPIVAKSVASGAGLASMVMGLKSFLGVKRINKSTASFYHLKDAEQKWLEKKMRLPLFKRIGLKISAGLAKIKAAAIKPFGFLRLKKKDKTAGIAPEAPAVTQAVPPAAPVKAPETARDFAIASPAPAPAVDEAEAAAARERAANRARRREKGSRYS